MNAAAHNQVESRKVNATQVITWCKEAWSLFLRAPLVWLALTIVIIVILFVVQVVPIVGQMLPTLLMPFFVAAFLFAAQKVQAGETPEIKDLFSALESKAMPLGILGALLLGAVLVITVVGAVVGLGAFAGALASEATVSGTGLAAAFGAGLIGLALAVVAGILIGMALWFAPALVFLHDVAPIDAVLKSFAANLKNLPAFLFLSLIYVVAGTVATIPLLLGWIVLVPLTMLASWASYRDVFASSLNSPIPAGGDVNLP